MSDSKPTESKPVLEKLSYDRPGGNPPLSPVRARGRGRGSFRGTASRGRHQPYPPSTGYYDSHAPSYPRDHRDYFPSHPPASTWEYYPYDYYYEDSRYSSRDRYPRHEDYPSHTRRRSPSPPRRRSPSPPRRRSPSPPRRRRSKTPPPLKLGSHDVSTSAHRSSGSRGIYTSSSRHRSRSYSRSPSPPPLKHRLSGRVPGAPSTSSLPPKPDFLPKPAHLPSSSRRDRTPPTRPRRRSPSPMKVDLAPPHRARTPPLQKEEPREPKPASPVPAPPPKEEVEDVDMFALVEEAKPQIKNEPPPPPPIEPKQGGGGILSLPAKPEMSLAPPVKSESTSRGLPTKPRMDRQPSSIKAEPTQPPQPAARTSSGGGPPSAPRGMRPTPTTISLPAPVTASRSPVPPVQPRPSPKPEPRAPSPAGPPPIVIPPRVAAVKLDGYTPRRLHNIQKIMSEYRSKAAQINNPLTSDSNPDFLKIVKEVQVASHTKDLAILDLKNAQLRREAAGKSVEMANA